MKRLAISKSNTIVLANPLGRYQHNKVFYTPCLINGSFQPVKDSNLRELTSSERLSVIQG